MMSSSSIVLLVIYASLINVYNAYLQQSDMYPWGAGKFEDRQEDILEEMRRNLVLDVKKEIIPDHFLYPDPDDNDTPVYLSNSEGFHFLIQLETKNDTVSSGPPTNNNVLSEGITNRRILIKSLKGLCAFHNKEYWSFEWCHRREVRQAHIKFNEGKVVRDPDWSLGTYQTSTIEREGGNNQNKSAPIIKMTDHFTGGQHCEETGTHRSTSVHFICCQKRPDSETTILVNGQPPRHGLSSATTQSGQLAVIYIDRVEETQVCQYDIDICVPKLCRAPPVESTSVVKTPSVTGTPTVTGALEVADEDDDQTLVNVVQSLAKNCLYRQEDWWMYEICFKTGIRQMHARSEGMQQSNGIIQHLQVIDDQYSLGEAPVDIYSDKSALMHAAGIRVSSDVDDGSMPDPLQPKETSDKSNASYRKNDIYKGGKLQIPTSGMPVTGFAKDDSPKFLSLEFKNGTACDIESLNRSTTVQIHCGMREVIMDILEDRTCHYTIKVSTPLLCLHAAFAPAKQALERFVLIPENSKSYIDAMEKKLGGSSERDSIWTNSDNYYDNQSIGGNPSNTLLSDEDHFIGTNEEDSDEYDDGSESESVSSSTNEEL